MNWEDLYVALVSGTFSYLWYKGAKVWFQKKKSEDTLDGYDRGVMVPRDILIILFSGIAALVYLFKFLLQV